MTGTTEPAPLDNSQQMSALIDDLQQQLQVQAPGYEAMLQRIHKQLSADPDLVHLLTDEQVGVIVAGLSKKKNVVLVEEKSKSRSNNKTADGKKSLKDVSLNDI